MKKNTRAGDVEFVFEPPFPHPVTMYKQSKIVALPDGKRYIADTETPGGTVFVARVSQEGTPDKDFGPGGWRAEHLDMAAWTVVTGLLLRADGGVVVALSNQVSLGLVCFRSDGTLDPGFGENGKIIHVVRRSQEVSGGGQSAVADEVSENRLKATASSGGLVLAADGSFYAFIGSRSLGGNTLIRCMPDGQLDLGFNSTGMVNVSHPTWEPAVVSIATTFNDGVVAVGTLGNTVGNMRGFFCRYNRDGSLDEDFGGSGFSVFDSESVGVPSPRLYQMEFNYVTALAGEGFAACGYVMLRGPTEVYGLVVCVDSKGALINLFNSGKPLLFGLPDQGGGKVEAEFRFGGIVEQSDRKIVVGGGTSVRNPYVRDMLLVRVHENGTMDQSFGGQGWVRIRPHDYVVNYISDLALDSDGKILVSGSGGADEEISRMSGLVLQIS